MRSRDAFLVQMFDLRKKNEGGPYGGNASWGLLVKTPIKLVEIR